MAEVDTDLLEVLATHDRVDISTTGDDYVESDGASVDTPEGRLDFEILPIHDSGADDPEHEPDAGVYVNRWFIGGYTVRHVHLVEADRRVLDVHEQRPSERAFELERHGVPERRAQIVALRESGLTYSEIVEATGADGPNHRGDVSRHLQQFNAQLQNAKWLVENADELEMGG